MNFENIITGIISITVSSGISWQIHQNNIKNANSKNRLEELTNLKKLLEETKSQTAQNKIIDIYEKNKTYIKKNNRKFFEKTLDEYKKELNNYEYEESYPVFYENTVICMETSIGYAFEDKDMCSGISQKDLEKIPDIRKILLDITNKEIQEILNTK